MRNLYLSAKSVCDVPLRHKVGNQIHSGVGGVIISPPVGEGLGAAHGVGDDGGVLHRGVGELLPGGRQEDLLGAGGPGLLQDGNQKRTFLKTGCRQTTVTAVMSEQNQNPATFFFIFVKYLCRFSRKTLLSLRAVLST